MFSEPATILHWPRIGVFLLAWSAASIAGAARAEEPAEASRKGAAAAIRILNDPAYHAAERKTLQQERLFEVLTEWFDFKEFSKRALADQWGAFTESERTQFVDVFSRFLGKYYLGELQRRYAGERVTVERQEIIGPARARVIATVSWMGRPIPVEIRKLKTGGRWMAYDVSVFGLSAVQVYRAQLLHLLRSRSPAELIALVASRIDE
ncbi:MAG: ABC transporter substrate-binding protein [Desulfobacterales bacterium]|jgi:phospholipid transport system substrate-binding protein|nr:ABC transporter substrate-binding protein [Desulfobacterales bacterium]